MIVVEMKKDLAEHPPKIGGLITVRQLLWAIAGLFCFLPVFRLLPLPFDKRIFFGLIAAAPALIIGWYPESEFSPLLFFRAVIRHLAVRKGRVFCGGYAEDTGKTYVFIRRHRGFRGI